jgi:nucleotide-binding universal stress UspA family protein
MKILVATDGSKCALHAVKYAATLAEQMNGASLTLISVHDDAGLRHAKSLVGKEEVADYLRTLSEKELKPARKLLDSEGVKFDMIIRSGHVAKEIVDIASKGKFDLIVLGSKGRSSIADMLLGSVAQRVLAMSTQPVLLVK